MGNKEQVLRLDYIDALRGLAILFIVFGHIPMYCYHTDETFTSCRSFTSLVQLPIFFFVSGFVFRIKTLSIKGGNKFILNKFRQLIIPATIIGSIYLTLHDNNYTQIIYDKFKGGYWFTFTLFELIIIQYIWEIFTEKIHIRNNNKPYYTTSLCLATILYIFSLPTISAKLGDFSSIIGSTMFRYYLYFLLGNIVRNNLKLIIQWKYKNQMTAIIILIFFILFIINQMSYKFSGILFHLNLILLESSSLVVVVMVFYKYRQYFSSSHCIANTLTFLGKRTLDIYLLHYFFLPKDLTFFGNYFTTHSVMILETLFGGIITVLVVGCSLFISELLRCNPIVSKYLLGTK